ncbi:MAG: branched-chain amino acid ABC transporter substrate-binding protein [Desulfovibrio sp.]|jgi:branched-chain amino acid transport system substrate-binding protein|nr:branched-chain amino acid ABC transporter substrate-binding protein [Desulfovibrio sp.]MCR5170853.1 branched-chain amino acid ABC transporter substrate-binding protein [Desulfovibrio sp.]
MKRFAICAAALVAAVALACPAQAKDTIKIGVPGAHTGGLASYGMPTLNAAKIVSEKVNASGGVLGMKIQLLAEDDQCKNDLASNAATKLISEDADVVMGHICSGPTKVALPYYNKEHIILMSPTATTPSLTAAGVNPMFFRTVAKDDAQAALTSKFILESLKSKKIAYVHDNDEYGKGFADGNKDILEKAGVETVLYEAVTPDAVDFSAISRKLRHAKPDVIVFGGYKDLAGKLIKQLRREKVNCPVIGPDGMKDQAILELGAAAENVFCSYPKDTSALPLYKEARDAHVKQFGSEPGFGYYNAYAAMLALIHGIEKAGSTETAKIIDVLHTQPVDTPIGSLTFNANGDAAGMGLSIYTVKDGKFVETEFNITLK